uniref:Uncharacterized protein n=1 Tax=Megaselia scalaris TaxID=36166 RepID=T1GN02_MEGSC
MCWFDDDGQSDVFIQLLTSTLYTALESCAQNKSFESLDDPLFASCESSSFLGSLNGENINISNSSTIVQDNNYLYDYLLNSDDTLFSHHSPSFTPLSSSPGSTYDCGNILGEDVY